MKRFSVIFKAYCRKRELMSSASQFHGTCRFCVKTIEYMTEAMVLWATVTKHITVLDLTLISRKIKYQWQTIRDDFLNHLVHCDIFELSTKQRRHVGGILCKQTASRNAKIWRLLCQGYSRTVYFHTQRSVTASHSIASSSCVLLAQCNITGAWPRLLMQFGGKRSNDKKMVARAFSIDDISVKPKNSKL